VEVAAVERRTISAYIETNGTLEAENEVDIVARAAAPIVELRAEEGDAVEQGQILIRLDDTEFRAALEIARVARDEAEHAFERARKLFDSQLISTEEYDRAASDRESALAQFEASRILLGYTEIRAPFPGLIVNRYADNAQQVSVNEPVLRISDFEPLLCPIWVPERDLSRLRIGQPAWLEVESWPEERFPARVLRISPVVDAATGTIKVTLEATAPRRLRPGMFARVFLEAETRAEALVIPKSALSLESIGDIVYVADGSIASRREVTLGYEEGDFVEVLSGLREGESVVVVGQDGLSDGTPVRPVGAIAAVSPDPPASQAPKEASLSPPVPAGPAGGRPRPDPSTMTAEQLERLKERMRDRGMTEEQIEERIQRMRERAEEGGE
jgi:RND family efflux transporter MFP subunit